MQHSSSFIFISFRDYCEMIVVYDMKFTFEVLLFVFNRMIMGVIKKIIKIRVSIRIYLRK